MYIKHVVHITQLNPNFNDEEIEVQGSFIS